MSSEFQFENRAFDVPKSDYKSDVVSSKFVCSFLSSRFDDIILWIF